MEKQHTKRPVEEACGGRSHGDGGAAGLGGALRPIPRGRRRAAGRGGAWRPIPWGRGENTWRHADTGRGRRSNPRVTYQSEEIGRAAVLRLELRTSGHSTRMDRRCTWWRCVAHRRRLPKPAVLHSSAGGHVERGARHSTGWEYVNVSHRSGRLIRTRGRGSFIQTTSSR